MIDIAASHKNRIGCSEVAAALGVSPWQTAYQLWEIKTGRRERDDIGGLLRIRLGNKLEQVVAELYQERTGNAVMRDRKEYTHPNMPLVGHIDRRIVGQRKGLEIKTSLSKWIWDEWGEEWTDQIPIHYLTQVMSYLLLTGWESWDVAALLAGPELKIYTVKASTDLFGMIAAGVNVFWRCVETDTPPPIATPEDAIRRWPESVPGQSVILPADSTPILDSYRQTKAEIKRLDGELAQSELALKAIIGDAETLLDDGGKTICTWKSQASTRLDVAAIKADGLYNAYAKTTTSRVFRLKGEK